MLLKAKFRDIKEGQEFLTLDHVPCKKIDKSKMHRKCFICEGKGYNAVHKFNMGKQLFLHFCSESEVFLEVDNG